MSNAPRQVLILAGGISHERDVSLRSGRRVADSLQSHGIHVTLRDPDASLLPFLREQSVSITAHRFGNADKDFQALVV